MKAGTFFQKCFIVLFVFVLMAGFALPVMAQVGDPPAAPPTWQLDISGMLLKAAALIPGVMFLVAAIKKLGVRGMALTRSSFAVGLALGSLSEYGAAPFVTFPMWLSGIVYGLLIGAAACGAYDLGDRWLKSKPMANESYSGEVYPR